MSNSDELRKLKRIADGHEKKLKEAINSDDSSTHAPMIELVSSMLISYQRYVRALEQKLGI